MRASLKFALGASVALSAVALWRERSVQAVQAIAPRVELHLQQLEAALPQASAASALPSLASQWQPVVPAPALRDPFRPPPPPPPPPAMAAPQPVAMPAPTPPQAPNYRFFGRLELPDGRAEVYLAEGDSVLSVHAGDRLATGYLVTEISAEAVHLKHDHDALRLLVPIPDAP